jgi:hypothetical protein
MLLSATGYKPKTVKLTEDGEKLITELIVQLEAVEKTGEWPQAPSKQLSLLCNEVADKEPEVITYEISAITEFLKIVKNELDNRVRFYPYMVQRGKKSKAAAQQGVDEMQKVVNHFREMKGLVPQAPQQLVFLPEPENA